MDANERDDKSWARDAAELEEQWRQRAAAEVAWWERRSAGQHDEVLRQQNLMYGGLIAIGVVLVQPFLTAPPGTLDLTAMICVIALSVAIPILAALVVLNSQETYRRRPTPSRFVHVARALALGAGFTGVVTGFWHITPFAGVGALAAAALALAVQSAGYVRVEREAAKATPEQQDQDTPDS